MSLASDGAIAGAAMFSIRALTPSTPVALPVGMASIKLLVWFGVIVGKTCLTSKDLRLLTKEFRVSERSLISLYFFPVAQSVLETTRDKVLT